MKGSLGVGASPDLHLVLVQAGYTAPSCSAGTSALDSGTGQAAPTGSAGTSTLGSAASWQSLLVPGSNAIGRKCFGDKV